MALELAQQLLLGLVANDAFDRLATLEEQQGWDAHHAKSHSGALVIVDIQFVACRACRGVPGNGKTAGSDRVVSGEAGGNSGSSRSVG